jgi:plastocyanin
MIGRALVTSAAIAGALALPAAAGADTANVGISTSMFGPMQVSVLAGDTVAWQNQSLRTHTVTSRDGSFSSPRLGLSGSFSNRFSTAGTFAYYCQIHPFMTGEVDVYPLLLKGPADPVSRGGQVTLEGRAEAGTSNVQIQADSGSGYTDVATAAVDGTGVFHATMPAIATTRYRAVAAAGASPEVQVIVMDRNVTVRASRRGHKALVRVQVSPRDPGGIVVLQLYRRERFGWWPVARRKLDASSRAVFLAPAGVRARAVLTLRDGWTPVVTSKALRLPRRRH